MGINIEKIEEVGFGEGLCPPQSACSQKKNQFCPSYEKTKHVWVLFGSVTALDRPMFTQSQCSKHSSQFKIRTSVVQLLHHRIRHFAVVFEHVHSNLSQS